MSQTRNNHFVPQWHQNGFLDENINQVWHLKWQDRLINGSPKTTTSIKKYHPSQSFYSRDLYSTLFEGRLSDEIERELFGPIDNNGASAVKAFLSEDIGKWHNNFQKLFIYLDSQKIRTPKGLEWIRSHYSDLSQEQLMTEMKALRHIHCTLWSECVRELVSAEESDIKFILSDHPVTIYNYAAPPNTQICAYPNDPDISLKASQTIFPLDKNHCLILTNLEYAQNPSGTNPLECRTNPKKIRQSLVSTINFINKRKLSPSEITKINHIIKARARNSIIASDKLSLFPEDNIDCEWSDLRYVLLPPPEEVFNFGGEIYAQFNDGGMYYQDAYGRTEPHNDRLKKHTDEHKLERNDFCGCGSGKKYKRCCKDKPLQQRTTWIELSIRERNLTFIRGIKTVLGFSTGKSWRQVREELSDEQISDIYSIYAYLWPKETDIYSLLPKADEKFRALYTGILDARSLTMNALPAASLFDEFLIESPIINPNMVLPKYNPILAPSTHRYQVIKDIILMLTLEPLIEAGIIALYPDPCNFDAHLMRVKMEITNDRAAGLKLFQSDLNLFNYIAIEDVLNSHHFLPPNILIELLMKEYDLPEGHAAEIVNDYSADKSQYAVLQTSDPSRGGQMLYSCCAPNLEMSHFIAQVTGSIIVTDSETRWNEFHLNPIHSAPSITSPWVEICRKLSKLPLDHKMMRTFQRSQGIVKDCRVLLKHFHDMIRSQITDVRRINTLEEQADHLRFNLDGTESASDENIIQCSSFILAPKGGVSNNNAQRMLLKSGCTQYDNNVTAVLYMHNDTSHK